MTLPKVMQMSRDLGHDHIGHRAAAIGARIKLLLEPLEDVCRYHERRGEDTAHFDVTPARPAALPFEVAVAPGGVNITSTALLLTDIPIHEGDLILALIAAITEGRVKQVRRLDGKGRVRAVKSFVFDAQGRAVFKRRKQSGLSLFPGRGGRIERKRFAAYRG